MIRTLCIFVCGENEHTCLLTLDELQYIETLGLTHNDGKNLEVDERQFSLLLLKFDKATNQDIMFNIVRRTTPTFLAEEIIGVQPMTGPTGRIFSTFKEKDNE